MLPEGHRYRTKLDELVEEFDEAVRRGADPAPSLWLSDWRDETSVSEALAELLCVGCELKDFDYVWLERQLKDVGVQMTFESMLVLVQTLALHQTETKQRISWSDFEPLGLPATLLNLRGDGDPFPLGYIAVDRFRLDIRIGAGGFGVVYSATDVASGERVALKTPRGSSDDSLQRAGDRLIAEAELLKRVSGAAIPHFKDLYFGENGLPILVMDFVVGDTLAHRLQGGPLPLNLALQLTKEIALALDAIHRVGLVHRDLTPANVLLTPDGLVQVIDFGIAHEADKLIEVGGRAGTLRWMSLEARIERVLDGRSDLWMLGALLYEMIEGIPLILGKTPQTATVQSMLIRNSIPALTDDWPSPVIKLLRRLLAPNRWERFDRAKDVAIACEQLISNPTEPFNVPLIRLEVAAWRLGTTCGEVWERFELLTREIVKYKQVADANPGTVPDYPFALSYGGTAATEMEVFRGLADEVGISIDEWPYGTAYRTLSVFLLHDRLKRMELLWETLPFSRDYLEDAFAVTKSRLFLRSNKAAELFELARQSYFSQWSASARQIAFEQWKDAPLPAEFGTDFVTIAHSEMSDEKRRSSLKQLSTKVESYLRYFDSDERP